MSDKTEIITLSEKDAVTFVETLNNPPEPNSNLKALFSSKKDDWETPDNFFKAMQGLFGKFDFDAAASIANHKCEVFLTPEWDYDALKMNWSEVVSRPNNGQFVKAWCNPPYGRSMTGKWVKKAASEAKENNVQTVMLLPARTDTKWFQICFDEAHEIYFIKGRLKFKGAKDSAPFPSMIVVFGPGEQIEPIFRLMSTKGEILS